MKRGCRGFDGITARAYPAVFLWAFLAAVSQVLLIGSAFAQSVEHHGLLLTPYLQKPPGSNLREALDIRSSRPQIAQMEFYNGRVEDYRESMIMPYAELGTPTVRQRIRTSLNRAEVDLIPQLDKTLAVNAVVNNRHVATFVIDTGASYTVITPQTAKAWGLKPSFIPGKTISVTTANGMIEAPMVTLKNVNLGGMELTNVQAVIIDLGNNIPASGLLGMNFFQGLEFIVRPNKLILTRIGTEI